MFLKYIGFHRSTQILPVVLFRGNGVSTVSSVRFQILNQRSFVSKSTNFENTGQEDYSLPNDKWSKDSIQLFNKLNELPGYLRKQFFDNRLDGSKLILRAVEERGKFFEYAMFSNPSLQSVKGVVQFGVYTGGFPGHVHGGAIAAILDSAMAGCIHDSLPISGTHVTVNLNINFKRSIPLNSSALAEANIDKVEGRKVFISSSLKTVDESEIYATSTAIFLMPKKS